MRRERFVISRLSPVLCLGEFTRRDEVKEETLVIAVSQSQVGERSWGQAGSFD